MSFQFGETLSASKRQMVDGGDPKSLGDIIHDECSISVPLRLRKQCLAADGAHPVIWLTHPENGTGTGQGHDAGHRELRGLGAWRFQRRDTTVRAAPYPVLHVAA